MCIRDSNLSGYATREITIPGAIAIQLGANTDLDRGLNHLVPTYLLGAKDCQIHGRVA